ncbi:N-acyl-D-amino-acid deacylase [Alkaliphilus metalliredigens QYMF]|uniref:N-acyl-D-amino-acid deacylase n=1 Tax=Alkaliphilus metalliredigens (strain QYMF) TaxID=293826 RepID=A6TPW0_ALKMQ|nr:amidohydrolase family protein [Alkaliphilus metalliredigens]ABR48228.1 N-acyl-D-amino-acid deacylase [Alkaliphilus metalliredigens QYMF]
MGPIAINNGWVIDPANGIFSQLNILIEDGKIQEISSSPFSVEQEIDAKGLYVCPGFVDIHMHEDPYDEEQDTFQTDTFQSMLRMGVTTAIGGNCGTGPEDIPGYLDAVERQGLPVNFGMLVPHASLRQAVGVTDRYSKAADDQIFEMNASAGWLLDIGCLGISYGIRYIPGITKEEMVTISKEAARTETFVAAHIRDDASGVFEAAQELLSIGKELEVAVHFSHIGSMAAFGQMRAFLSLIDDARSQGMNVSSDCYPYAAFSTGIGQTTYDDGFLERYQIDYDQIEIADGEHAGQRCTEKRFHQLRKERPETITIAHVMNEEEVNIALEHPSVMIASDGMLKNHQGHPRAAGTFPRFLRGVIQGEINISLSEAIAKCTCLPAEKLRIQKGTLSIGFDADVVVFNPETLRDRADFNHPANPPEGIEYVLVNGKVALRKGALLEKNQGRLIGSQWR